MSSQLHASTYCEHSWLFFVDRLSGQLGKCEMELSEPHQGMRFEVEVLKDDPVSNSSRTNSVALSEEEIDATFFGQEFRQRTGTTSSQVTQSDLSRLGMLTAISDAGNGPNSSVFLIFCLVWSDDLCTVFVSMQRHGMNCRTDSHAWLVRVSLLSLKEVILILLRQTLLSLTNTTNDLDLAVG